MEVNGQHNRIEYNTHTTVFVHPGSSTQEINQWKDYLLSIVKGLPSDADTLKPLIQLIVASLNPHRIYMLKFGGTDNSPEIHTDLLVVVPDNNTIPFADVMPVFDIACLKLNRVRCSLHSITRVKESIEQGHIFYSLHCIDENLIYDDKKVTVPALTSTSLQNMKLTAGEKFMLCFEKALSFYQSAQYLQENYFGPVIPFYLHQAVELVYRAILQCLNGFYKKTHVIRSLKSLSERCAPHLNSIFPDDTPNESRLLDLLENGYKQARYDAHYSIEDNDLYVLFVRAKRVIDTGLEMIKQVIPDMPIKDTDTVLYRS